MTLLDTINLTLGITLLDAAASEDPALLTAKKTRFR